MRLYVYILSVCVCVWVCMCMYIIYECICVNNTYECVCMCICRGHTSYVNCAIFTKEGGNALTASSDGSVRLWDVKTTECLLNFR
jgi:WD40 repeat protein